MKTSKQLMLSVLILLWAFSLQAQDPIQVIADSIAKRYLSENKGGGLQIGILQNGKEYIFSYGEIKKGSGIKPDTNSVFEIGQITQVFTSSLFSQMSIHGEINPDEPIGKYLPIQIAEPVYQEIICEPVERFTYPSEKGYGLNERFTVYACRPDASANPQPILVCYLSTHTSGFPQHPSNMKRNSKNPYAGYSKDDLYKFLSGYTVPNPVGFNFHYSDIDMAVLGHILELKSGKPYESLLDSTILSKCSMNNTFISFPESRKTNTVTGYNKDGKEMPHWDFQVMGASLGLKSTVSDLLKFLKANLNNTVPELSNAFDYTHNSRVRFKNKIYGQAEAGLGWIISPLTNDIQYEWQEGVTGGCAAFIGFLESYKCGVVVLSNHAISVREAGKNMLEEMAKARN